MKPIDDIEKFTGTVYILAALVPLFMGPSLYIIMEQLDFPLVHKYYFFYLLPISIWFYSISLNLTKTVDLGQRKMGRLIRRAFYLILILIPVAILILRVIDLDKSLNIGI